MEFIDSSSSTVVSKSLRRLRTGTLYIGSSSTGLTHFLNGTGSMIFRGIWNEDKTVGFNWTRIGNKIHLSMDNRTGENQAFVADNTITCTNWASLDSNLKPVIAQSIPIRIFDGATYVMARLYISSTELKIYKDLDSGLFPPDSTLTGWQRINVVYDIANTI